MAEKTEARHGAEEAETLTHRIAKKADALKWFILAFIILLAAVGAVFSYLRREQAALENRAEDALYQAVMIDLPANPEGGLDILGKVAEEFRGLPAGARAQISRFSYAFNTREFAAAEQQARDFLQLYPQNPMTSRMRLALGQALAQQGKLPQAIDAIREAISGGGDELLPEAKLALAQAMEREAEDARDNPDEYRRRLEATEAEYNDIVVRAQISVNEQRGYWPADVVLLANFSLTVIKDKLMGYSHQSPRTVEGAAPSVPNPEDVSLPAPPSDGDSDGTTEAVPTEAVPTEEVPVNE